MSTYPAPAKPADKPAGELVTLVTFDGISLWCSYTQDEDGAYLSSVHVGVWVPAIELFGLEQFDRWADALNEEAYDQAVAFSSEMAEERAISAYQYRGVL